MYFNQKGRNMNFFKDYSKKLEKNAGMSNEVENSSGKPNQVSEKEDEQEIYLEYGYQISPLKQSEDVERIIKKVALPYYENKVRALEVEEYECNGRTLKRIKNSVVNFPVNTVKLLLEMMFILDKKNRFLLEAKQSYITYRYGLLGHMYSTKLLTKPVAEAGLVVSRMLRGLAVYGYERCVPSMIEQPNNFIAFKRNPDVSREELQDMHEFTDTKNVYQQMLTIGITADKEVYKNYSNYFARHAYRLEKLKVYIDQEELKADISTLITGSPNNLNEPLVSDTNDYLLNMKMPDGSYKYMSTLYKAVNPEVFKLLMYLKPLWSLIDENSCKTVHRDNYKEPDKVFKTIRGSVDIVKAKDKVLEYYNPSKRITLEGNSLAPEFDPFTHKSFVVESKKPPKLYAPSKKAYALLIRKHGRDYMNPNINIGDSENPNVVNPFTEYLATVKGTNRETIARGLMAYPHEVWRKFCDLVQKHRETPLEQQIREFPPELRCKYEEMNLLQELQLNGMHLLQEQIIHFYKEIVSFSVNEHLKHNNIDEKSWVITRYNDSLCTLLFKGAQVLVSLGLFEVRDEPRLGLHTFRSFSIPRIKIREHYEAFKLSEARIKKLQLDQMSKLTVINWDAIKGILDRKLPLLLHTIKPEAMAIVANHHDFAETLFGSSMCMKNGYTLQNVYALSFNSEHGIQYSNYNAHKTTTIYTNYRERGLLGLYRAGVAHYLYKNPVQTVGYYQWFSQYNSKKAIQRFSTQSNLHNYRLINNTRDVTRIRGISGRKAYRNFSNEDICCTYATDPRSIIDGLCSRDNQIRSNEEKATRNKLIELNRKAQKQLEIYSKLLFENKTLSEELDAVVMKKVDKDLNEIIKKYEDNSKIILSLEPEVTRSIQRSNVAKSVVRTDRISEIKHESIKVITASIMTNYLDQLTDVNKEQCLQAHKHEFLQEPLGILFKLVLSNPELLERHYSSGSNSIPDNTPIPIGDITVLDDPKYFVTRSQVLTDLATRVATSLSTIYTCSVRFCCSIQEIYEAFKDSILYNDENVTKALHLTLHRKKHSNRDFGTRVFKIHVSVKTSVGYGLEPVLEWAKNSLIKEAEEQQAYFKEIGVTQPSFVEITELEEFAKFITGAFKITEPIFQARLQAGAQKAHKQIEKIEQMEIESPLEKMRLKKEVFDEHRINIWHYEKWIYSQNSINDKRYKKAVKI